MNNIAAAEALLRQAMRRLETVRREARAGSAPYAVRSAQECVELSLKASLRLLGIEYPKQHDVARALVRFKPRFPTWFDVDGFAEVSRNLAEKREAAMYGDEAMGRGPNDLFTKEDAASAAQAARQIYQASLRLVRAVRGASRTRRVARSSNA